MKMIKGRYGYANAHDMYTLLGTPQAKLPAEGIPLQLIDGVRVYVKPLPPPDPSLRPGGRRTRPFGLRVMAVCDDCGRHVPVGRMHQHGCCRRPAAL